MVILFIFSTKNITKNRICSFQIGCLMWWTSTYIIFLWKDWPTFQIGENPQFIAIKIPQIQLYIFCPSCSQFTHFCFFLQKGKIFVTGQVMIKGFQHKLPANFLPVQSSTPWTQGNYPQFLAIKLHPIFDKV